MKRYEYMDGESGAPIVRMTMEQAEDCHHQGQCDAEVEYHLDKVEWLADDDTIRRMLKGYGAWDDLADADQHTLRMRALWVAAGDIKEDPELYAMCELEDKAMTPKEREKEIEKRLPERARDELDTIDLEKRYCDMIDECYSFDSVGGRFAHMQPSRVLREMDPVAYRCGMCDWEDSESDNIEEIDGSYYDRRELDKLRETIGDEIDEENEEEEEDEDEAYG